MASNPLVTVPILELWAKWVNATSDPSVGWEKYRLPDPTHVLQLYCRGCMRPLAAAFSDDCRTACETTRVIFTIQLAGGKAAGRSSRWCLWQASRWSTARRGLSPTSFSFGLSTARRLELVEIKLSIADCFLAPDSPSRRTTICQNLGRNR